MSQKQPKHNAVEHREIVQEFRVADEGQAPTISGYACLFDVESDACGYWTEIVDPHSFDKLITPTLDCRALFNHDPNHVLGRTTAGTLHLTLDSRGLAYVIDPPDTQLAKDLIVSMRRKDVTQSSFAFVCKRDQWTENPDGTVTRRILEFDQLLDISPVTYPAYAGTTSQVRSLPASMPKEIRSKVVSKRGLMDELDPTGCACDCPQCESGNCNLCSDDNCLDAVCACYNQRSRVTDTERRRMEMRLTFVTHKL